MANELVPDELRYTEQHEWLRDEGEGIYSFGLSYFAQDALGDITFIELPAVGSSVTQGEPFGVVESVKTYSDVYAPISGEVVEANEDLLAAPGELNADAYGAGWLIRVKASDPTQVASLMDALAYGAHLEAQD